MRREPMIPPQGKRMRRDANMAVAKRPGATPGSLELSLGENQTITAMVMN